MPTLFLSVVGAFSLVPELRPGFKKVCSEEARWISDGMSVLLVDPSLRIQLFRFEPDCPKAIWELSLDIARRRRSASDEVSARRRTP